MSNEMRRMPRHPVRDNKDYALSVISFKYLDWTDAVANLVDMSPEGAGIELKMKIDPGFVWFSDTVDGRKGGMLMWSMPRGGRYRGGIKFVDLSPDATQDVESKLTGPTPMKDPTIVVDTILEALRKDVEDTPWNMQMGS